MKTPDFTAANCLMLNAGQLAFPNTETRAVALALASVTHEQNCNGATGTGFMPGIADLTALAQEFIAVEMDERTTLHCLDHLVTYRYLAVPYYDFLTPYTIDTTMIPMRVTSDDCVELDYSYGVESGSFDAYGFGDQ